MRKVSTEVVRLHVAGKGLLEAPRYDDELGLVFSDARLGGLHRRHDDSSVSTLIPEPLFVTTGTHGANDPADAAVHAAEVSARGVEVARARTPVGPA